MSTVSAKHQAFNVIAIDVLARCYDCFPSAYQFFVEEKAELVEELVGNEDALNLANDSVQWLIREGYLKKIIERSEPWNGGALSERSFYSITDKALAGLRKRPTSLSPSLGDLLTQTVKGWGPKVAEKAAEKGLGQLIEQLFLAGT